MAHLSCHLWSCPNGTQGGFPMSAETGTNSDCSTTHQRPNFVPHTSTCRAKSWGNFVFELPRCGSLTEVENVWLWNWHKTLTSLTDIFFRAGGTVLRGSRLHPQNAGMPPYQDAGAGMLTTKRRTTAAPKKKKKGCEKGSRPPAQNRADNEPVLNISNVSSHVTESPC
jgi:hypothetical protein